MDDTGRESRDGIAASNKAGNSSASGRGGKGVGITKMAPRPEDRHSFMHQID